MAETSTSGSAPAGIAEHGVTPAPSGGRPARSGLGATDLALIAVFAALIAVLAIIPPLFMIGAVPFALQMIGVMVAPMLLGSVRGGLSVGLYILVGVLGLPVFAGQASGPGVLLGATGGFLIGYLVGAFAAGAVATAVLRARPRRQLLPVLLFAVALLDMVVIYALGIAGMMINAGMSLRAALVGNGIFFAIDLIKAVLVVAIALAVLRAFPRMLPAPAARVRA